MLGNNLPDGLFQHLLDVVPGHSGVIKGLDKRDRLIRHWTNGLSPALIVQPGSGRLIREHKLLVQSIVGYLHSHLWWWWWWVGVRYSSKKVKHKILT